MVETLAEELVLLIYDIRGKCRVTFAELDSGIGGALLSELNLTGRLKLDGAVLAATVGTSTGDPILDALLADIEAAPRTPREWIAHLGAAGVRERLLTRMAERGRIEAPGRPAGTRYPVRDVLGLWDAQQRVVAAVTTQAAVAPRTLALGALVVATGLSRALFATSGNWRALRARMQELTRADWPAEATGEVIAAQCPRSGRRSGREPGREQGRSPVPS